jgi:cation/acetate symporter
VIALLGVFYLLPPIYGALGRVAYPTLPPGVGSDTIVLRLPETLLPGLGGQLLTAMLAGGAFAAFLSTASGLAMSVTGVIDQELLRPRVNRFAGGDVPGIRGFRVSAILAVVIPYAVSRATESLGLATTVGLAFAVAAATFAPLLMLGVWWRRLSTWGAMAGLVVGATSATVAIGWTIATGPEGGWSGALLANPAMWATPLAIATAVLVSLATPSRIPAGTTRTMVRLHTPERVALARSRTRD